MIRILIIIDRVCERTTYLTCTQNLRFYQRLAKILILDFYIPAERLIRYFKSKIIKEKHETIDFIKKISNRFTVAHIKRWYDAFRYIYLIGKFLIIRIIDVILFITSVGVILFLLKLKAIFSIIFDRILLFTETSTRIFTSIRSENYLRRIQIIYVYRTGRFGEIQGENRELCAILDVLKHFF